ncbi:hypothetical protein SERLA73DRAFT_189852 [Serpula lacrymans var. lacrymans S7.3]|uniref:Uncharacterized protein n=1 Tax=Serpula lacrymans var. lacrymans (strain S7.3) TaxID=936435 RepID=F8QEN7_SERL3|nr:hypothetical protein SERLA73DRAFT_189852 [Serpula lacrymans var. lacrymans S7.3]
MIPFLFGDFWVTMVLKRLLPWRCSWMHSHLRETYPTSSQQTINWVITHKVARSGQRVLGSPRIVDNFLSA